MDYFSVSNGQLRMIDFIQSDQEIARLCREYNVAVANGLNLKARSINRVIRAKLREINRERYTTQSGD
jgi:hypothetical protein